MGVKTTSDRVRSCGTTPVFGGALYHTVLLRVGRGRCEGTPGRWDANDVEFGKLWVPILPNSTPECYHSRFLVPNLPT